MERGALQGLGRLWDSRGCLLYISWPNGLHVGRVLRSQPETLL